ncbi:MAG TPA: 50S ribosomal protein L9 [Candidatus Portnoybacteria bacterium]|nr:50S ribosomal protein L9 [Candidatus Portnoybacteria bacterium]
MKIILLEKIDKIGDKFEIKEVKNGYAYNFLLPRKLAKLATPQNLEWLKKTKEKITLSIEKEKEKIKEITEKLKKTKITFETKASKEGKLYGGITASQIIGELKNKGVDIKKEWLKNYSSIKEIGEHQIKIKLPYQLEAILKIIIKAEKETK